MNHNALNDSATTILANVLRIQSRCLERLDEAFEGGMKKGIADILVETLDAHARQYLQKLEKVEAIPAYTKCLRETGENLILNAEQRSFLVDPYRDAKLRQIAESSGDFILRKLSLSPAQQEETIQKEVARVREEVRPKALKWLAWKTEMVFEIEYRFEARYRHWEAKALKRVRASRASGTLTSAGSDKTGIGGAPSSDGTAKEEKPRATSWQEVKISFVSDERVQIRIGTWTETCNYGELGFRDRRDGKPNRAWICLRMFAKQGGTLPIGKGSLDARVTLEKAVQEIRKALRSHFGLPADPLPLVSGAYTAVFKIEWDRSAEF
jgi:hypothetical protein